MKKVKLRMLECKICKHKWTPRKPKVWLCPNCNSARWNEGETKNEQCASDIQRHS